MILYLHKNIEEELSKCTVLSGRKQMTHYPDENTMENAFSLFCNIW